MDQVKPYSQDKGKKQQVSSMFDRIAPYYDLLNRVLSLGIDTRWRRKLVRKIAGQKPGQVLDVATGTGDVALEIHRQLPDSLITGADISEEMLEIGRKKVAKKGLTAQIRLQAGDSENLPFPDNTFDAITVAFGVRNFEDLDLGLKEMNRVLKKGGKLAVLEFSKPVSFPFKQMYNAYFRYVLPVIGRLTSKDPRAYSYLYESVQAFPDGEDFIRILKNNGYKTLENIPLTFGICTIYLAEK
ncbi:MAG: bifunctional demethylmenaquinone methyltransferase/2-methoxy-6-polyprenyl-1,4-benzoquinol methylase UbiE [Lewinella sp.]|nr:bifunctional demethylmenaquinone methyltransferase/2-methoxy-6-polyprenyl-1,4-benzoquinol methylase UbiE [Lewinella sp.]